MKTFRWIRYSLLPVVVTATMQQCAASAVPGVRDLGCVDIPRKPGYLAAVRHNGFTLACVPEAQQTMEMYLAAVQRHGAALELVPYAKRTEALCLAAVRSFGGALKYVPDEMRTAPLCLVAVRQHGPAIHHVPEPLRTEDMIVAAVRQTGCVLMELPVEQRTEAVCFAAVQTFWPMLSYVPDKMRTEAMCVAAVQQSQFARALVPETLRARIDQLISKRIDDSNDEDAHKTNSVQELAAARRWMVEEIAKRAQALDIRPISRVANANLLDANSLRRYATERSEDFDEL